MFAKFKFLGVLGIGLVFTGCASVEMESNDSDALSKSFNNPQNGKAGLYIYRNEFIGCGLKKSLWIDGDYLGETSYHTYFYTEVEPGKHIISSESEFGENHIGLNLKPNENTFVQQEIKVGVFVARTKLNLKSEEAGKKDILDSCKKAKNQINQPGRTRLPYIQSKFNQLYEENFVAEPNDAIFTTDERMGKSH